MYATRVTRRVQAPATVVYEALVDPDALAAWRVPENMTSHVHTFEAREGGAFRISLTYDEPSDTGKSGGHTDTYHGHFAKLVPGVQVVEVFAFETDDAAVRGTMTMTTTLTETDEGTATDVEMLHEDVPDGIPRADNELGMRMAVDQLARLVEERNPPTA